MIAVKKFISTFPNVTLNNISRTFERRIILKKFTKYPLTSVKADTSTYEVDIYDEEGEYERTKTFTDIKTARKWIDQFNYDSSGGACAVPFNFSI